MLIRNECELPKRMDLVYDNFNSANLSCLNDTKSDEVAMNDGQ